MLVWDNWASVFDLLVSEKLLITLTTGCYVEATRGDSQDEETYAGNYYIIADAAAAQWAKSG